MVEQVLDGFDGHAGVQQQGRRRRPDRMRRIHAHLDFLAVGQFFFMHSAGDALQIRHQHAVHAALAYAAGSEDIATPGPERAEEGTAFYPSGLDVLGDGLRRAEMYPLRFGARALELKPQRRFVTVLVEVGDIELAAGFDACPGVEVKLQNGAITDIQQRISRRLPHQLPPVFLKARGFHRRDRRIPAR